MEIRITTPHILRFLEVFSWIIFIGLCIEAGGILFNTAYTLFINPQGAANFWEHANLEALYRFDRGHFAAMAIVMCIVAVLKAVMFYSIVLYFKNKKINFASPFHPALKNFITNLAYASFAIGIFSLSGARYSEWLTLQGTVVDDLHKLHIGGFDVWLFMSVILFVISQLVKRGIEIQTENELTI